MQTIFNAKAKYKISIGNKRIFYIKVYKDALNKVRYIKHHSREERRCYYGDIKPLYAINVILK